MRKLTMLVGLVTIFSLALAGPALADLLVELGPGDNTYNERRCPTAANNFDGDEEVFGRGGDDRLRLQLCGDVSTAAFPEDGLANTPECAAPCTTDSDADTGKGNRGNDVVRVDDGDIQDTATGGRGNNDRCRGDRDLGADNAVGGTGPNEDISDDLAESCEDIIWTDGDFYNQT
jgi:hypothetical protein